MINHKEVRQKKSHEITNFKIIYIIFSAYLERAIDSAIEAFQVYDKSPTDGKLSYEELLPVSNISPTCWIVWFHTIQRLAVILINNIVFKKIGSLTFIFFKVPQLAVTEEIFKSGWDLNKDGFLTMAELATVIFKQQLLGPIPNQQREM